MPTRAGRVKVKEYREGMVVWRVGINWGSFYAEVQPLNVVSVTRRGTERALVGLTYVEAGKVYVFNYQGVPGVPCGLQEYPFNDESDAQPDSFFVSRRTCERYMERMGCEHYRASEETLGRFSPTVPHTDLRNEWARAIDERRAKGWVEPDYGFAAVAALGQAEQATQAEIIAAVQKFLDESKDRPFEPDFKVLRTELHTNGEFEITVQFPGWMRPHLDQMGLGYKLLPPVEEDSEDNETN